SGVVNFAQGEYVMLGGVIGASLLAHTGSLALAVVGATLAGALLGALQERLTLAPVRAAPDFIQITITLGVAVVLRGVALIAGGLGIGLLESFAAGYVSSGYKDAIVYGVLLAYLLARGGVFVFGRAALLSR